MKTIKIQNLALVIILASAVGCVQVAKDSVCLATSLKCEKARNDHAPSKILKIARGIAPLSTEFKTFPHTFSMLLWPNVEDVQNWELKDLFDINTKSENKLEIIAEKVTESGTTYDQVSKEMLSVDADKNRVLKSQKEILGKYTCKPSLLNIGECFNPDPDAMDEIDTESPDIYAQDCSQMQKYFTPKDQTSSEYETFVKELDACNVFDKELKAYEQSYQELQNKRETYIKSIESSLGKYDYKTNNFISTEYGSSEVVFNDDGTVKMNLRIQTTPGAEYLIYSSEGNDPDILIVDNKLSVINETYTLKIKILERTVKGDRTGVVFSADLKGVVTDIGLRYLGDMEKSYKGKVIQKGLMKLIFPPKL